MYKVEVGMQVYVVPTDRRIGTPYFEEISKVGRKWVTTNRGRKFDIGQFASNGKSWLDFGNHAVYASKQMHDTEVNHEKLFRHVQKAFSFHHGTKITLEQLVKVADILGIEHDVEV